MNNLALNKPNMAEQNMFHNVCQTLLASVLVGIGSSLILVFAVIVLNMPGSA